MSERTDYIANSAVEHPSSEVAKGLADLVAMNTDDIRDALHRLEYEMDCYQQTVMHLGYDVHLDPTNVVSIR